MIKFVVDGKLVTDTEFFLIDQKIKLVIDRHDNKEKKIETGIFQGFLVLSIFFSNLH